MYEREMAKRNMILKVRVGSHLYGTSTPESDEDFVGIFIPDAEYLLGLRRVEEVDMSVNSKDEAGKNTSDAVDFKLYSLAKFVRLALDNNPNILEILFVNKDNILFMNNVGEKLLSMRHEFLSKNVKHKFLGYAFSQKHKMVVKLGNYERMTTALKFLEERSEEQTRMRMLDVMYRYNHPVFVRKKDHIQIGDMNIPVSVTVKKALKMISDRVKKFGSRIELVSKYGFDTKFATHLIRLLKEGTELLETGTLEFPLRDRELLMSIRKGKYGLGDVIEMANEMEEVVESLYETSKVPSHPNHKKVEQFLISTQSEFIS